MQLSTGVKLDSLSTLKWLVSDSYWQPILLYPSPLYEGGEVDYIKRGEAPL